MPTNTRPSDQGRGWVWEGTCSQSGQVQQLRSASRGSVPAGTATRGRKRRRALRIPQRLKGSWDPGWKRGSRFGLGGGGGRGPSFPFARRRILWSFTARSLALSRWKPLLTHTGPGPAPGLSRCSARPLPHVDWSGGHGDSVALLQVCVWRHFRGQPGGGVHLVLDSRCTSWWQVCRNYLLRYIQIQQLKPEVCCHRRKRILRRLTKRVCSYNPASHTRCLG